MRMVPLRLHSGYSDRINFAMSILEWNQLYLARSLVCHAVARAWKSPLLPSAILSYRSSARSSDTNRPHVKCGIRFREVSRASLTLMTVNRRGSVLVDVLCSPWRVGRKTLMDLQRPALARLRVTAKIEPLALSSGDRGHFWCLAFYGVSRFERE